MHGLQKLLDICAEYADSHNILFHPKNCQVRMAILPNLFKHIVLPNIVLGRKKCTIYRVRHKDIPIRKVKASHDLIFLARGTKF